MAFSQAKKKRTENEITLVAKDDDHFESYKFTP